MPDRGIEKTGGPDLKPRPGAPAGISEAEELRHKVAQRLSRIRHKLLVLSGKGGVGKSTVAVNLAVSLARAGQKVGLLDVDIHGPSVPKLLNLEGRQLRATETGMDPVPYSRHLSVVSIGFLLRDGNEAVIWRGPRKFGLIRQFLADVEWGDLDFLVIDSPPGTGDEPLAACELTAGDPAEGRQNDRGAVVVTTPQSVAINDVRKCVRFCRELALPIHGVIENMSGLTCPHCGGQIDVFLRGGGEAMAGDLDVPFLGRIPLEPAIVESGERGRPHVLETLLGEHDGKPHASAAAFEAIARRILSETTAPLPPDRPADRRGSSGSAA